MWALAAALLAALPLLVVVRVVISSLFAHARWRRLSIPGPAVHDLISGHVPLLADPTLGPLRIAQLARQYGPLFKLQFLNTVQVVLTDPDTIHRVVKRTGPGPYLPKPRELYRPLETSLHPQMPNILTASDSPQWKAVRQGVAPCFSASNLKKVLPLVLELTQRVAARMEPVADAGGVWDVADSAKRITSDVMGEMLFGEQLGATRWQRSEYLELFNTVLQAQASLINNPWHLQQVWSRQVRAQRAALARHNDIIADKATRLIKAPPAEWTIAAHLLAVRAPATGRPLSRDQLKSELAIILAAGFETTSHAITWVLAMLSAHQDVQRRVVCELQEAGLAAPPGSPAGAARDIGPADLGRLPYMAAVVKEVLRLCPPAPWGGTKWVPRELAASDVELCGYRVPKGTYVMMPLLALSLSSHVWGDSAFEFSPERWTQQAADGSSGGGEGAAGSGGGKAWPDPLTFMAGPRDCVGQGLAKLELQVVLATLLSRYSFTPGPVLQAELDAVRAVGQPPVCALHNLSATHITLQPKDGQMLLHISRRAP